MLSEHYSLFRILSAMQLTTILGIQYSPKMWQSALDGELLTQNWRQHATEIHTMTQDAHIIYECYYRKFPKRSHDILPEHVSIIVNLAVTG